MSEQSHKREMNDAVRADFERLRARRERRSESGDGGAERLTPAPPPPSLQPRKDVAEPAQAPEESRSSRAQSRLRFLRRRG